MSYSHRARTNLDRETVMHLHIPMRVRALLTTLLALAVALAVAPGAAMASPPPAQLGTPSVSAAMIVVPQALPTIYKLKQEGSCADEPGTLRWSKSFTADGTSAGAPKAAKMGLKQKNLKQPNIDGEALYCLGIGASPDKGQHYLEWKADYYNSKSGNVTTSGWRTTGSSTAATFGAESFVARPNIFQAYRIHGRLRQAKPNALGKHPVVGRMSSPWLYGDR